MNRDYERLQDILMTIAYMHPDMPISEALPLAQAVEAVPGNVIDSGKKLVDLAESLPAVTDELPHRKINAIKALRAAMNLRTQEEFDAWGGLKVCKEAVEEVCRRRGH